MKRLTFLVALIACAGAQAPAVLSAQLSKTDVPELYAAFPGLAGRVFEAGQQVTIQWELSGPGVRHYESEVWGECELLFSANGGKTWTRITPQLSVSRRDHTWVVPDVPTRNAKIGLQVGIEGDGEFHHFASKPFTIRSTRPPGVVQLAAPSLDQLRGGSTLEIEWSSTVKNLKNFEVLVSSDRGAHLLSVGETTQNRFSYAIPDGYEGFLTVQIVAHRHGEAPLRSALDERSTFRVQAGESATR